MRLDFTTSIMLLFTFLLSISLTGCGGSDANSMIADANDSNVKRLATMYSFYHMKNSFKGPKDEAALRGFIEDQDPKRLKLADIDATKMDELFTSERDGEPFVIRYGVDTVIRGPSLPVVFETTGVDGMRQIGFCNGSMQEVDSSEYDRLLAGESDNEKIDDGRE
jgi:hypothetical protein